MASDRYTAPRAVPAEGARVGIITCLRCGAALLLDPGDKVDVQKLHNKWHDIQNQTRRDAQDARRETMRMR